MAFDIKNTLHAVETYVQNLGLFSTVQIGEPKQAVGQGLHADKMIFNPDYTVVERA